jgi:hypothetical protein
MTPKEQLAAARKELNTLSDAHISQVMVAYGLPKPIFEHRFVLSRRWRADLYFERNGVKLAVEVEGGAWTRGRHTRGAGFIKDMEKYNRYTLEGIWLLRCVPDDLLTVDFLSMIKAKLKL